MFLLYTSYYMDSVLISLILVWIYSMVLCFLGYLFEFYTLEDMGNNLKYATKGRISNLRWYKLYFPYINHNGI